jgi:hypothetical protein
VKIADVHAGAGVTTPPDVEQPIPEPGEESKHEPTRFDPPGTLWSWHVAAFWTVNAAVVSQASVSVQHVTSGAVHVAAPTSHWHASHVGAPAGPSKRVVAALPSSHVGGASPGAPRVAITGAQPAGMGTHTSAHVPSPPVPPPLPPMPPAPPAPVVLVGPCALDELLDGPRALDEVLLVAASAPPLPAAALVGSSASQSWLHAPPSAASATGTSAIHRTRRDEVDTTGHWSVERRGTPVE